MSAFNWNECFLTGLDEIDRQHRRLVELINQVGEIVTTPGALRTRGLQPLLEELADYADTHFKAEEALMERHGLCERFASAHAAHHQRFFHDLARLRSRLEDCAGGACRALLDFLVHWLAHHILGTDLYMAQQIAEIRLGRTPEEALAAGPVVSNAALETMLAALRGLFHQISERNHDLERLNDQLESRIAERTAALRAANQRLAVLASTDALTRLPNRRAAVRRLSSKWERSGRAKTPLAAMMIDVDGFKHINDRFGHEEGDRLLVDIARCMAGAIRSDDMICRLGGDEFLIVCPDTPLPGALNLAEAVRETVSRLVYREQESTEAATVSIGVACRTASMAGWKDLLRAADAAVYLAKSAGRNCVRHATEPQTD